MRSVVLTVLAFTGSVIEINGFVVSPIVNEDEFSHVELYAPSSAFTGTIMLALN